MYFSIEINIARIRIRRISNRNTFPVFGNTVKSARNGYRFYRGNLQVGSDCNFLMMKGEARFKLFADSKFKALLVPATL